MINPLMINSPLPLQSRGKDTHELNSWVKDKTNDKKIKDKHKRIVTIEGEPLAMFTYVFNF
jgi:hypothetical protein